LNSSRTGTSKRFAPLGPTAAIVAALLILAGCGGSSEVGGGRIDSRTLTLYVSVPLDGASAVSGQAVANAAQMAVDHIHARIGRLRIVLKQLDDATPSRAEWDPGQTSNVARLALNDPTAVGYVGDLNSGASAVSIPLLNRLAIPQVSPTSTAVGLTSSDPGAAPGEPDKYYPTGVRTFARVTPSDTVQAAVQVQLQRSQGCTRTFVVDDGEVDGEDMATSFDLAARAAGLQVIATQQFNQGATDYRALAASVASTGADCVLISAITDANAVLVTRQLAAAVPSAHVFATAGMAESTFAQGIPPALARRLLITSPGLGPSAYPRSGKEVLSRYARRYGPAEPAAILGYEATNLMLSAIGHASGDGKRAASRANVLKAIFATRDRDGVLGKYSITADGDTSLKTYGVWQVVGGRLQFLKALDG
jgi:branched-chain amino acid transport system substrate-binding protein